MIYKIVFTGEDCAGKTTAIERIYDEFTEKGYNVVIVPDAEILLINSGIIPSSFENVYDFQKCVMGVQINLEKMIYESCFMDDETIMLCNRGIMDDKASMDDDDFYNLLHEFDIDVLDICSFYDLVFHLRTYATDNKRIYSLVNSFDRIESVSEAIIADKKTLENWSSHGRVKVIGNDGNFEDKINRIIKEIYGLIKKPLPIQKYKYLVNLTSFDELNNFNKFKIEQYTLLNNGSETTYKKIINNDVRYKAITKIDTDYNIVLERCVSREEYLVNVTKDSEILKKTRYTFEYEGQYFKFDIFDTMLILEVETTNNEDVKFPPFIEILNDVSNDVNYNNPNIYFNLNKKGKVLKK